MGYPTANLGSVLTLLPGDGVYAGAVSFDGANHAAAINIGPNPTFGEQSRKVEVHIIGFAGDLYGRSLEVDLIQSLRDTVKFDSIEQLKSQLAHDVKAAEAAWADTNR